MENDLGGNIYLTVVLENSCRCRRVTWMDTPASAKSRAWLKSAGESAGSHRESAGSRVESMASRRESAGCRPQPAGSRVESMTSHRESAACRRESAGSRVEPMASCQESAGSLTNFNEWMRIYWVFAIKWKFSIRPKPLTWLISMKLTKILKLDRCTFTIAERDLTIAHQPRCIPRHAVRETGKRIRFERTLVSQAAR